MLFYFFRKISYTLFKRGYVFLLNFILFFSFFSLNAYAQLERNVTVGLTTASIPNFPFNGGFDFSWSSMLYGKQLFHGTDLIIKIGFEVANNPVNYTMQNQRIYMRLTNATSQPDANYPGTAGFTLVYDGPITYNGSGWTIITLQTPFLYDIAQNLEVLCENRDGSKAAGFPQFNYHDASVAALQPDAAANKVKRIFADGTFPIGAATIVSARPNTKFIFPTPVGVGCVSNTPASDFCSSAPLINNLNGYCGNTKSTYTVSASDPSDLAFCGRLENTSWLKFVASETTAKLNIIVDNCQDNSGIQMRIYETTNCGAGTFTEKSNCWSPTVVQPGTIEATGLVPGRTYYLMIDGYAGDQCDYTIYINSGVQLSLAATYSKIDPVCLATNNGSISVYAVGGVKPYTYTLSGTASQNNASGVFSGLAKGTYNVTVTDNSGTSTQINNITLAEPFNPLVIRQDTTICRGAQAKLTVSGADSYSWTASPTDATLTANTSDAPVVSPTQTTTYTVTGTVSSNRNLIFNGDFELGNVGFSTNYNFRSTNPSGDQRAYGIIDNANNWVTFFSNTCVANGGTGKMMVVDGSVNPTDTVWSQTIPVTPNTNYSFSYFLQSLGINPQAAKIDVLINGVSLAGSQPAPGIICSWQNVFILWNSGAATTAKISIINRETSVFGNDFALDDIEFIANTPVTCSFSKSVTVTVSPSVTPTFPTYGPLCEGSILIQPILPTTSNNGITGTWNPAGLNALVAGEFPYTFTPASGQCAEPYTFILKVRSNIKLDSSTIPYTSCTGLCNGSATITIKDGGKLPYTYQWNDPLNQTSSTAIGLCEGRYTVVVRDSNSVCQQTATVNVIKNVPVIQPIFNPIAPICRGGSFILPTTSTNGIIGSWSPAINNTATTTYTFKPNTGQCASDTTITVIVNQPTASTENVTACGEYTWVVNGQKYTVTGNYIFTTINAAGCDSVVTLNLTITQSNQSFFTQDTIRACGTSQLVDAGSGYSAYAWNTGATTQTISVSQTGWYKCTVTLGSCTATDSVFVSLVEAKILNNDTTVCINSSVQLGINDKRFNSFLDTLVFLGKYNGHFYYKTKGFYYWTVIDSIAKRYNCYLATISDVNENNFIANSLNDFFYFTGFRQNLISPTYSEPSGGWEWSNGESVTYINWGAGEPNNDLGRGNFGHIGHSNFGIYGWNDVVDEVNFRAVIESNDSLVNYSILWSTGETTPSITVAPTQTTKYFV
ncbi:MAG: lectin-like protein, partial [Bacteroidota bacterium]